MQSLTVARHPTAAGRTGVVVHVLVTGASGNIAAAVVPELLSAGHTVTGLARSDRAAAAVRALGAEVRRGDLDDLDGLAAAAAAADAVVHLAFKHDLQQAGDLPAAAAADLRAIEAMGAALQGSGKVFVGTGATGALALAGHRGELTESDVLPGGPRIDAENAVVALAEQGVRSTVVRLAPTVHGDGAYGFASQLLQIARARGTSGYLGEGANRWPSVDTRDVAVLYRLAAESAPAGSRWHAVAEQGVALREIAAAVGRRLGVEVTAVPDEEADERFGHLRMFVDLDNPTSSRTTREALGWTPTRPGLLADLETASTTRGQTGGRPPRTAGVAGRARVELHDTGA